jgi:hypothetical protein
LQKLSSALHDWKCLESFKSIETASIPVIKMVSTVLFSLLFSLESRLSDAKITRND